MPNWNVLQESFLEGECSPRFISQVQTDVARKGLQRAENAYILQQGPVTKRMGTEFAFDTGEIGYDKRVRIWPYLGDDNIEKLAVFLDEEVKVYNVIDTTGNGSSYTLQSAAESSFEAGGVNWQARGSNTDVTGPNGSSYITRTLFYLLGQEYPGNCNLFIRTDLGVNKVINGPGIFGASRSYVQQQINLQPDTVESVNYWLNTALEAKLTTGGEIPGNWKMYVDIKLGTGPGLGDILTETHEVGGIISGEITTAIAGDLWFRADVWLEVFDSDTYSNAIWNCVIADMQCFVTYASPGTPLPITTPYPKEDIDDLHFVQSPFGEKELICLHPNYEPQRLWFDDVAINYDFGSYPFTGVTPADWGPDSYPSIGCGHNGRLILSGVSRASETVWGSAVFDWYDFDLASAVPEASQPYNFVTQERGINTWVQGFKDLSFGTTRTEFIATDTIGDTSNGVTIGVASQSAFGAKRMPQKLLVGDNVMLPTGNNTTMRLWRYSDDSGGYISPDVTLKSEHLGRRGFKRSFYTRDPNQTLWNVMEDGSMTVMCFDDQFRLISWSTFLFDGDVLDGCTLTDEQGNNVVFLVIRRIIKDEAYHYVERIQNLKDISKWGYTDSRKAQFTNGVIGLVGNFFHLREKTVAVFYDGRYDGLQVVNDLGQVNVTIKASIVEVGIPYVFQIETFPESSIAVQSGLTSRKRYSKVGVRGIYTLPPFINGQRPPDRSPQGIMGIPEPAPEAIDSDVVDLNINNEGTVTITEPLPYRCTITGIYGKLTSNQL